MNFLPDIHMRASPDSALHSAIAATSYINFFRRCPQLRLEDKVAASKHYAQALVRVQTELQDEESAGSDSLLMAVYLMGLYEVCFTECVSRTINRRLK